MKFSRLYLLVSIGCGLVACSHTQTRDYTKMLRDGKESFSSVPVVANRIEKIVTEVPAISTTPSTSQNLAAQVTTIETSPALESAKVDATVASNLTTIDITQPEEATEVATDPNAEVKTVDLTKKQAKAKAAKIAKRANTKMDNGAGVSTEGSVYFAFDSYSVEPKYHDVIRANATKISGIKEKVMIQGHTDNRGSSEYNLALGQRRSDAVRRALVQLGVPDTQLEAVSFGEEKPKATGNDEAAWSQNRRADITYTE